MFGNPVAPDKYTEEGEVLQVDIENQVCKVKTASGRNLDRVRWLTIGGSSRYGDRGSPKLGNRVLIQYGLGVPVILGALPKLQESVGRLPLYIDSQSTPFKALSTSSVMTLDSEKPRDILPGDRVISTDGGAMIAALRGGSLLLRGGSRLAEIFISKWDDCIKVISRNWEHYTDVSSDMVKNIKGRVYRYIGYTNLYLNSKTENYSLEFFFGDVSAAEAVKTNYQAPPSLPSKSSILYKEKVTGSSGGMYRTLDESGNEDIKITSGSYTQRLSSASELKLTYNGQNTLTINDGKIELIRADGALIRETASGIEIRYQNGKVELVSSGVYTTYGDHFINVTSSGIQMG